MTLIFLDIIVKSTMSSAEYNQKYYRETLKPRRTKMKILEEQNAELRREIFYLKSRISILERKLKEEKNSSSHMAEYIFRRESPKLNSQQESQQDSQQESQQESPQNSRKTYEESPVDYMEDPLRNYMENSISFR